MPLIHDHYFVEKVKSLRTATSLYLHIHLTHSAGDWRTSYAHEAEFIIVIGKGSLLQEVPYKYTTEFLTRSAI